MNTLTSYDPSTNLCILLLGQPKTGKTIMAAHFPAPYILDMDNNLGGPARWLRKNRPAIAASLKFDTIPVRDGKPVPPEEQWVRAIDCTKAAVADDSIRTIVIDTLTTLDRALCDHILFSDNPGNFRSGKAKMQIQHYGEFARIMTTFIMSLNRCGKNVIINAHEEVEEGEMSKTERVYRPAISGKLKHTIGALMTDVWRTEAEPFGIDKTNYNVRVRPTAYHKLGTSLDLPPVFQFDYALVEKAIKS